MANEYLNIDDQEKLFSEFISPGVVAELAEKSKMFANVQKDWKKVDTSGKYAKQTVMVETAQSVGASSTDDYPESRQSTPEETQVFMKRITMGSIGFSNFALMAARKTGGKGGAVMAPIEFEKKGVFITAADDISRQLLGDGSGRLCRVNGAVGVSTTVVVDNAKFAKATKFLKAGRILDDDVGDGTTQHDAGEIDSVDSDTQITLKANTSIDDDDYLYNDNIITTDNEKAGVGEAMGLDGIIDDDDPPHPNATNGLQQLAVGSYPVWTSYVVDNGGTPRALDENRWVEILDEISDFGIPKVGLCSTGVRRAWYEYLKSFKSLPNQKSMWGGFSGLPFFYDGKEIPIVPDKFVRDGAIYFLNTDYLTFHVMAPEVINWEKGTSGGILQKVAGKSRFVAEFYVYGNIGVSIRAAMGKELDIEEK